MNEAQRKVWRVVEVNARVEVMELTLNELATDGYQIKSISPFLNENGLPCFMITAFDPVMIVNKTAKADLDKLLASISGGLGFGIASPPAHPPADAPTNLPEGVSVAR